MGNVSKMPAHIFVMYINMCMCERIKCKREIVRKSHIFYIELIWNNHTEDKLYAQTRQTNNATWNANNTHVWNQTVYLKIVAWK